MNMPHTSGEHRTPKDQVTKEKVLVKRSLLERLEDPQVKHSLLERLDNPPVSLEQERTLMPTQFPPTQHIPAKTRSGLVSSQGWTASSGISGKRKPRTWRHSIRSCIPYTKPTSTNQYVNPHSSNTPSMSISLLRNTRKRSVEGDMRMERSTKTFWERRSPTPLRTERMYGVRTQTQPEKPSNSYAISGETYSEASRVLQAVNRVLEEKASLTKRNVSINPSYHGTPPRSKPKPENQMRPENALEPHSPLCRKTSLSLNERLGEQPQHHRDSLSPNGSISSKEKLSISMLSSATSTTLPLLRRMWDASVVQKSLLEEQIQLEKSKRAATRSLDGTRPQK
ncbi:hypothetical protein L208DRAFT_1553932 [Tricholoma matsutake]|nr:hypothetical protein L208DRAFT_1553932 [Tricholoma matsutake 945]